MNQPSQYHRNTALCGRLSSQNICIIGIITLLLLTATLTISVAAAGEPDYNLSFFSNGSSRDYIPSEMEFGANVGKDSIMTVDSLESQTRKHVYIQFYERWPTEAQEKVLENYSISIIRKTGGGHGAWIASMPASLTPADIPAEAGLRWMGEIPPEDKWRNHNPMKVPGRAYMGPGMIYIGIRMYEDVSVNDSWTLRDKYANTSSKCEKYLRSDDRNLIYEIITKQSNLTLIAEEDAVKSIWFLPEETVPATDPVTEPEVQSPDANTSPVSDTNTSPISETTGPQSVPGFELIGSLTIFLFLFYARYRR